MAFDPWRCDEANYRFGSVGDDTQLLLWDFSPQALPKPKTVGLVLNPSNDVEDAQRQPVYPFSVLNFDPW